MLPSDLKDYRADDPFQLIAEEAAGWILCAALFTCWIADRMGWLT